MNETPLLSARGIVKRYGGLRACDDVSLAIWPGEVLAIVGESGSGKTTLLRCLSGQMAPDAGRVIYAADGYGGEGRGLDFYALSDAAQRSLMRTQWGFVHQNPRDGLRMNLSAGANIGERMMAVGARHYGQIRATALAWLERVEIDRARLDDHPVAFSGGMQQRLQIARNLVSGPRLVFMDEPTGGLDVSVQARLLDLLRGLVATLGLSVIIVTHDLAVARLLAHRMMVMRRGVVVEEGLADQVLDDPQHPYSQLLVASVPRP